MLLNTVKKLFKRDLNKLKNEIASYSNEDRLWIVDQEISNCAGNLCLHIVGNLNTYIGANLGNTGYIRHRELEFSLKDIPRSELLSQIDTVMIIVENILNTLTSEDLEKQYTQRVFEEKTTTGYFLIHLTSHLAYHLGQINYHRRLLDV